MPEGDYRVVDTDYSSYSIVYSCSDILGVAKCENVWILSRDEELSQDKFKEALNTISERVPWYELSNLYRTKQGGKCKYLPLSYIEDAFYSGQYTTLSQDLDSGDDEISN